MEKLKLNTISIVYFESLKFSSGLLMTQDVLRVMELASSTDLELQSNMDAAAECGAKGQLNQLVNSNKNIVVFNILRWC
jgi:hypothetical protein